MNQDTKKHAYLVDSSIYIFRGWHVYSDEIVDRDANFCVKYWSSNNQNTLPVRLMPNKPTPTAVKYSRNTKPIVHPPLLN